VAKKAGRLAAMVREHARPPSEDKLDRLRAKVRSARDLELEIRSLSELARSKSKELGEIKSKELPDLFQETGVKEITLEREGNNPAYRAELKPYYHANIGADWEEERREAAFSWIEKQGHGDVIKTLIVVEMPRGSRKLAKQVEAALRKLKVPFTSEKGVPWNTLTALVRELIEKHKTTPPLDTLGAHVGVVVQISPVKEKTNG
jgi:hypothetical protein